MCPKSSAALFQPDIPAAPPLFIAVLGDDPLLAELCLRLCPAWRHRAKPAERHVYTQHGHGFGMLKQGLPSDSWIERLHDWMASLSLLRKKHAQ